MFFSPSRKVFDFRVFPAYITVTSGPLVLDWARLNANESAVAYYGRSSSGFVKKKTPLPRSGNLQDLSFLFFFTETNEQHKGRLPTVVTFCLFLSMRFVSN